VEYLLIFYCIVVLGFAHCPEEGYSDTMSRFGDKMKLAAGAVKRVTDKAEARADAIIAKETDLVKRVDEVFTPHEQILGDTSKGLDEVEKELAVLTNGAPSDPLSESSNTSGQKKNNGDGGGSK
jgi:hypothetical protein